MKFIFVALFVVTITQQEFAVEAKSIDRTRLAATAPKDDPDAQCGDPVLRRGCRQAPPVVDVQGNLDESLTDLSQRISEALKQLQEEPPSEGAEESPWDIDDENNNNNNDDDETVFSKRRASPYEDNPRWPSNGNRRNQYQRPVEQYESRPSQRTNPTVNRYENPSYGNLDVYIGSDRSHEDEYSRNRPEYNSNNQGEPGTRYQEQPRYMQEDPREKETYPRNQVNYERASYQGNREARPRDYQGDPAGVEYRGMEQQNACPEERQNYNENRGCSEKKPEPRSRNPGYEKNRRRDEVRCRNYGNKPQEKRRDPNVVRINVDNTDSERPPPQEDECYDDRNPDGNKETPRRNQRIRHRKKGWNKTGKSDGGYKTEEYIIENGKEVYRMVDNGDDQQDSDLEEDNAGQKHYPNEDRSCLEDDMVVKISFDNDEDNGRNRNYSPEEKVEISVNNNDCDGENVKIIVGEDLSEDCDEYDRKYDHRMKICDDPRDEYRNEEPDRVVQWDDRRYYANNDDSYDYDVDWKNDDEVKDDAGKYGCDDCEGDDGEQQGCREQNKRKPTCKKRPRNNPNCRVNRGP